MSLFILTAAAVSFACDNPRHHDGDAIRCAGIAASLRLHAIDAPEMPGACRPGRACTPGDPYAARDYLAGLTAGRSVRCSPVDVDHYGRTVVDCTADGENIGCAMVAAGMAVERYGSLDCRPPRKIRPTAPRAAAAPAADLPETVDAVAPARPPEPRLYAPPDAPARTWGDDLAAIIMRPDRAGLALLLWLLALNSLGWGLMTIDRNRACAPRLRRRRRVPEALLLLVAALGGSIAVVATQQRLRHMKVKQPFATALLVVAGLHLGLGIGGLAWMVLPA